MVLNSSKNKKEAFFCVENKVIDDFVTIELLEKLEQKEFLALDMACVEEVKSSKFIEALLENKFRMVNLQVEVLAYLSLILKDGFLKTYINKNDLINQHLTLIMELIN